MPAPTDARAAHVADRAGAQALVADLLDKLRELDGIMARESDHIRVGRLREGLAETERKTALSAAYLQGLETVKANAIALARFVPDGIETLRAAHRRFAGTVEANQVVLATARTVSESLVKTLAEEMSKARSPTLYGRPSHAPSPYGRAGATAGQPLVLSRNL